MGGSKRARDKNQDLKINKKRDAAVDHTTPHNRLRVILNLTLNRIELLDALPRLVNGCELNDTVEHTTTHCKYQRTRSHPIVSGRFPTQVFPSRASLRNIRGPANLPYLCGQRGPGPSEGLDRSHNALPPRIGVFDVEYPGKDFEEGLSNCRRCPL